MHARPAPTDAHATRAFRISNAVLQLLLCPVILTQGRTAVVEDFRCLASRSSQV
jgi:hypothetical protein